MFYKLVVWLLGSRDYKVLADDADRAARILSASGANYRHMLREDDCLIFTLMLADCAAIERILQKYGIAFEITRQHGLAYLLHRYRYRPGIAVGITLFFIILALSGQFIWTIRVVGNESTPSSLILSRLRELGCGVGTYIPSIGFDYLHNQYLIEHGDLAWIAVNVRGTNATVEVRELELPEIVIDEDTPYNLVAAEDGIIRDIEILRGDAVAERDALVRKGELLASGIEETPRGFKLVHARGSVVAEVKRSIRIEVPLETTVMETTGVMRHEKYLNFFGISVKLFAKGAKITEEYDTIVREYPLRFFGEIEVPLTFREIVYREIAPVTVTLSEEEAKSEAYRRLREECAAFAKNAELAAREVHAGLSDGAYVIECRLTLLAEIAEELPIYTE